MNDKLSAPFEREVLGWPDVSKETGGGDPGQGGFWVPPATVYRRTSASYRVRRAEDVPGAVELFRMNYERAVARDARHAARANPTMTQKETT